VHAAARASATRKATHTARGMRFLCSRYSIAASYRPSHELLVAELRVSKVLCRAGAFQCCFRCYGKSLTMLDPAIGGPGTCRGDESACQESFYRGVAAPGRAPPVQPLQAGAAAARRIPAMPRGGLGTTWLPGGTANEAKKGTCKQL
jgi:hypothetical protein